MSSQRIWPVGHGGWFYCDLAEFEGGAATFLAEGLGRHERVLFVADDPGVDRWPAHLVNQEVLVLRPVDDVYAPLREGDLAEQRAVFATAVAGATRDGFSGLRVAADDTRLAREDLDRWTEWEAVAEALMAESPLTGLCGFDRSWLGRDAVNTLTLLHRQVVGL